MTKDCVSRAEVIKNIGNNININFEGQRGLAKYEEDVKLILQCLLDEQIKRVEALPSVTPTHGTCKGCEHYKRIELNSCDEVVATCKKHVDRNYQYVSPNFYCADFEKRGDSDGSN